MTSPSSVSAHTWNTWNFRILFRNLELKCSVEVLNLFSNNIILVQRGYRARAFSVAEAGE